MPQRLNTDNIEQIDSFESFYKHNKKVVKRKNQSRVIVRSKTSFLQ